MNKQLAVIIGLLMVISMLLWFTKNSQDKMNDKFDKFTNQISIYDDEAKK